LFGCSVGWAYYDRGSTFPSRLPHDEYGHFDGIVTPADILDAIAGAFRFYVGNEDLEAVLCDDGSWLLMGWMPADEMADQLGVVLPQQRHFETVAGLVIHELQHLPEPSEAVEALGWRFEVIDMGGRRADKVLARRIGSGTAALEEATTNE
jgi:putative hemolysin